MLEARNITYRYADAEHDALTNANLTVEPGTLVALLGANGCGKSTLTRLMAGSFSPTGGEVTVDGKPLRVGHGQVGLVRQDPQSQLVCEPVYDEVAFGPRNFELESAEVDRRVRESLEACGIANLVGMQTSELSGGEQQRLALAGILALKSPYLVLDEPASQLDSTSALRFMDNVRELVQDGTGVLLVTHNKDIVAMADRVAVMSEGRIVWSGSLEEFQSNKEAQKLSSIDWEAPTFQDDRTRPRVKTQSILKLVHATVFRRGASILHDVTVRVPSGKVMLLSGRSGSGKTTLGMSMAGMLKLEEGKALIGENAVRVGDVGLCMQRAEDQLFCDTVFDEVAYGPQNLGLGFEELHDRTEWALRSIGVSEKLWKRHPMQLSGGERRRVAIAGIIAMQPAAFVFDEPTDGLDGEGRIAMHALVRELASNGASVVVISHDVEEWLGTADEVTLLANGEVVYSGPAREVASSSIPYRLAGLQIPRTLNEREETENDEELYAALQRTADAPHERIRRISPMQRVPAWIKVFWIIAMTVALFATSSLRIVAAALVVSIVAMACSRITPKSVVTVLGGSAVVLAFALIANAIVVDGTGDVALVGTIGITTSGALRGLIAVLRILTLVFSVVSVAASTTATEIANVLLAPIRLLGGRRRSVEGFCMVITLTIRLIPLAYEEFRRVEMAQRIRKAPLSDNRLSVRLRAWLSVLVPMIVALSSRSSELGYALTDRGYGVKYATKNEESDDADGGR